jgi:hypothetical protein
LEEDINNRYLMNSIPINIVSRVAHGLRVSISHHWCMTFRSRAIYLRISLCFYKLYAVFLICSSYKIPVRPFLIPFHFPPTCKEIPEVGS